MKIILVNNNPAVSRLGSLALNKIGHEFKEIADVSELSDVVDLVILDSDIDTQGVEIKDFASKILYLSSKKAPIFNSADKILPKPFLPTEFIKFVEELVGKNEEIKPASEPQAKEDEVLIEGVEFIDELGDDFLKEEMLETDEDEFKLDDLDTSGDDVDDFEGFDELNEIVKAIDTMDDEPLKTDEKEENFDEIFKVDEAAEENGENLDELKDEAEFLDESGSGEDEFKMDDIFGGSIEDIKNQINEIDRIGEQVAEDINLEQPHEILVEEVGKEPQISPFDEPNDDKFEDILADEPNLEDELLDDEKFVVRETTDELLDGSKFEVEELGETALKDEDEFGDFDEPNDIFKDEKFEIEEVVQDAKEDEASLLEELNLDDEPNLLDIADTSGYSDLEQISEKDMALALNESELAVQEPAKKDETSETKGGKMSEVKAELANAISQKITASLNDSELKDALKNLNIKINISFEEK